MNRLLLWIVWLTMTAHLARAEAREIAVVLSEAHPSYQAPVDSFRDMMTEECEDCEIKIYDIEGNRARGMRVVGQLIQRRPALIYTLGIKATYLVGRYIDDTPVLFSMVLNVERYESIFVRKANLCGISLQVPASSLLGQYRMLVRSLSRLGILFNPASSSKLVDRAQRAGAAMGLKIQLIPARTSGEVRRALKKNLDRIDGLWAVPDAALYQRDSFATMVSMTQERHKPFLTYSREFVRAGALFAISVDYATIGNQAADLALQLIDQDVTPQEVGIVAPLGTTWVVHRGVLEALSLTLPEFVSSQIDEMIDE